MTVCVVGRLTVCHAGRELSAGQVGTRKARTLLAVLAVHGGLVPTDRIAAAVWGSAAPRDPPANVATLVSRLRARLGRYAIAGGRCGYRLGDGVRVDLAEIAGLVAEAERRLGAGQPALALRAARRAADRLDRGAVLIEHPDADWAEPARAQHTQLLRRSRHAGAEAALRTGELRAAHGAALAAVRADPFDESAARLLMRAQHAAGEPARAIVTYHGLRATLATELGVDPAPATRTLHQIILRDTAHAAG